MRAFHQLVFEGFVSGTTDVYSVAEYNALLGEVDKLCIGGFASQVSYTATAPPTLTIQVENSADQRHWTNRNAAAEVTASVSTTSANPEPAFSGHDADPASRASLAFARLRIRLTAASGTPKAQLRIWVTGRDGG